MKKTCLLLLGLFITSVFAFPQYLYDDYKLVWADEFNGNYPAGSNVNQETGLNESWWTVEVHGRPQNQEKQYYTNREENIKVIDGKLIITCIKEHYGDPGTGNNAKDYTSGRMNTRGKVYYKYGKVEASVKMPSGAGVWPAFWMMGNVNSGWPRCGEIDIMEYVGSTYKSSCATHTQMANGNRPPHFNSAMKVGADQETIFHTFTLEWTPTELRFYINNEYKARKLKLLNDGIPEWPFDQWDFYVILNFAMGGMMGGNIDPGYVSSTFEIDYVRWYRSATLDQEIAAATPTPVLTLIEDVNNKMFVYPNPFSDYIVLNGEFNADDKVDIIDQAGRIVASTVYGDGKISTSQIPQGFYILSVISETGTFRTKIVK